MGDNMTPLSIDIILHYNSGSGDFRGGDFSSPGIREIMARFVEAGLLRENSGLEGEPLEPLYELTDGGDFYLQSLMAVPLPVRRWGMPDKIVVDEFADKSTWDAGYKEGYDEAALLFNNS